MKKIIVGFIMFVMVFAFLAGNVPTASAEVKKVDLAICGGSIGGAWAAIGEGVGEVIRRSYPGSNTAYEVGQEAANLALVSKGKVQLGIAHAQLINMAAKGNPPFKNKIENLRALCVLYKGAVEHFIIKSDTGINKFADIKGKKFPLKVYFNEKGRAKVELGLGKGKKLHDKRETEKARDWNRDKARILKTGG